MGKIYLSVQEAERLLPKIRPKIENIVCLNEELEDLNVEVVLGEEENYETQMRLIIAKRRNHEILAEIYYELEELFKLGAYVKDFGIGLVDFYSKFGDNDILLCWKLGERKIKYWHELESGYAGRKPIELIKEKYQEQLKELV